MVPWGDPGPPGFQNLRDLSWAPPRLAGTLRAREHPQGCSFQVTPCLHDLWACVSPSFCSQKPRTGKGGAAPTSYHSWWWTRDAPMPLGGCEGRAGSWQREMRKPHPPPVGICKENTLKQHLMDPSSLSLNPTKSCSLLRSPPHHCRKYS